MKCKWNNPRKRKQSPKKAEQLSFGKNLSDSFSSVAGDTTAKPFEATVNLVRFKERLCKRDSNAGWLTNSEKVSKLDNTPDQGVSATTQVPNIIKDNIDFQFHDSTNLDTESVKEFFDKFLNNLKISEEQCVQVELISRGQNKNRTWKEQRKGRITSSSFGHVFVRKDTTPPDNLVKQVMGYNNEFKNSHISWGISHEPAVRRLYTKRIQAVHPNTSVKDCGLIINPSYPYLGASPDGLVDIPNFPDGPGLLEIKCPSSDKWKRLSPHECVKDSSFFCSVKDNEVVLKRHHSYFYQVQGQMALTGRKWCDFVVWTLKHPMSVERIYFDGNLWLTIVEKLKIFYLRGVLPEVFSSQVKRDIPLYAS
eukprot:XP_014784938.1 PREDICTED: uncharacterized protein LOC106879765 [Octopus bimaculoides]